MSGGSDRTVRVWDMATGRCLRALEGHQEAVAAVAVSVEGSRAVSASLDGTVRAWDLATGKLTRTYQFEPPRGFMSMTLAPDGTRFATFEELPGVFESAPKHCQLHEHEHGLKGFGSCRFPANVVRSATSCEEERTLLDSICYPGAIILALLKIDFARHGPREERFAD